MNNYEKILLESQENPDIVGLILLGSRGKGFENEYSDYDLSMIVRDDALRTIQKQYDALTFENVDLNIISFDGFKRYANWDSDPEWWDRYDYAHTKILVDKTGELPDVIKGKGYIPHDKLRSFIERWIDGYINSAFRSIKCIRNKNKFGAHVEAANSVFDLLTLVFALEGRHRPFLGYTEKELYKYPLMNLPWTPQEFITKIEYILKTADLKTQQEILSGIENLCIEKGYKHILDAWEGKDKWAITFVPS
jgi:predicted nucleotidyltransferase